VITEIATRSSFDPVRMRESTHLGCSRAARVTLQERPRCVRCFVAAPELYQGFDAAQVDFVHEGALRPVTAVRTEPFDGQRRVDVKPVHCGVILSHLSAKLGRSLRGWQRIFGFIRQ